MGFNGGITQTNSVALTFNGQWPFLNMMKQAQNWTYRANPTDANAPRLPVIEVDGDGYVTSIVAGTTGVTTVMYMYPTAVYSGVYVLTWDGAGTVLVPGNGANVGWMPQPGYGPSSLTSTNSGGRYEFILQNDATGGSVGISATSAAPNHIRNIRLFRKTDETDLNAGLYLTPEFKAIMASAGYGCFRTLGGWIGASDTGTNACDMAVWADRAPRTYFSWRSHRFDPTLYAGRTVRTGNCYVVTGTASISDKLRQHINVDSAPGKFGQFTVASITNSSVTGQPAVWTLTAHGLTTNDAVVPLSPPAPFSNAVPYFANVIDANTFTLSATRGGAAISTTASGTNVTVGFWMSISIDGGTTYKLMTACYYPTGNSVFPGFGVNAPAANTMATIVYDQTTDMWSLTNKSDTNTGTLSGMSPEVYVDICAELGVHPWIVAPFLTMETGASPHAVTDFMPSWAAYIRDTYPWMKPIIEPPNETWNTAATIDRCTFYTWGVAWSRWQVQIDNVYEVYGKWASTLGKAMSVVFGNDRTKYSAISSFQTGPMINLNNTQNSRITSAKYVSQNGGDPAYKWIDRVCASSYYTPARFYQVQECIDGFNWTVTYASDPANQTATAEAYSGSCFGGSAIFNTVEAISTCFSNLKTIATNAAYTGSTIKGMVFYEGGHSVDYLAGTANWTTGITGATQSSVGGKCILSLAATTSQTFAGSMTGNPGTAGMQITPSGIVGMTQLNGNTYTITKAGVAGGLLANQIEINVDSSGFTAYVSGGTCTWVNSATYSNNIRKASKFTYNSAAAAYNLMTFVYKTLPSAGFVTEWYSDYFLIGANNAWSILDPDRTIAETPRLAVTRLYNRGKRRLRW